MKNKKMTRKEKKNWTIAGVIALLLLLVSWKKKPQPSVEVGTGDFGEFGTDGILAEDLTINEPITKTPNYVASKGSFGSTDLGLVYEDMVKEPLKTNNEKPCSTCY